MSQVVNDEHCALVASPSERIVMSTDTVIRPLAIARFYCTTCGIDETGPTEEMRQRYEQHIAGGHFQGGQR